MKVKLSLFLMVLFALPTNLWAGVGPVPLRYPAASPPVCNIDNEGQVFYNTFADGRTCTTFVHQCRCIVELIPVTQNPWRERFGAPPVETFKWVNFGCGLVFVGSYNCLQNGQE